MLVEENHDRGHVAVHAEIHELNHLDVCFPSYNIFNHITFNLGSILNVQSQEREEADERLIFVDRILNTTLNEHRNKHFVACEYLKEIDVTWQELV